MASPVTEPRASRFHVTSPPPRLYAILSAFAKETKKGRSDAWANDKALKAFIRKEGDANEGESDDVRRFLINHGVIANSPDNSIWMFSPEKADELFLACIERDQSLTRGQRSFVEMSQRDSDPGPPPAPTIHVLPADAGPSPEPEQPRPVYDFLNDDDDILELRRDDLAKGIAEMRSKVEEMSLELNAVQQEQARRAEKRHLEHEIEELRLELEAKQKRLAAFNTY